MPIAACAVLPSGALLAANGAFCDLFKYTIAELPGITVKDLIRARDHHLHSDRRDAFVRSITYPERAQNIKAWGVQKDGTEIPVQFALRTADSAFGPLTIAGIIDTSELERIQLRLLETAALQSAILDGANAAVITLNAAGQMTGFNTGAEALLGYSRHDALGQHFRLICSPDQPPAALEGLLGSALRGVPKVAELTYLHRDGRPIPVLVSLSPCATSGSEPSVVTVATDFTELKRTETALRESARARLLAEPVSGSISQFLATVSHRISTPVHGIVGTAERLSAIDLSPSQRELVSAIRASAASLLNILNTVLEFLNAESGQVSFARSSFPLRPIIQECMNLLGGQAGAKSVSLSLDYPPGIPLEFLGDAAKIRQILLNLLENAITFTPIGAVSVRVSYCRGAVGIAISDSGLANPPDSIDPPVQQFSPLDGRPLPEFGGAGPGLANCLQLARLMGGDILLDTIPGIRTAFFVSLPLPIAPCAADGNTAAPQPPQIQQDAGLRVLLVEDNKINLRVAQLMLQKLHCRVETADNGERAVASWRTGSFDVIFMDYHMPVMDGVEATIAIRQLELPGRRIPIIAFTANTSDEDRKRCIEAGMDQFLTKPATFETIRSAIERLGRLPQIPRRHVP